MKVIKDGRILKAMEAAGHIKMHEDFGETAKQMGMPVKCSYIDDGQSSFVYKNKKYITKYVDGCFSPYVFEE